MNRKQRMQNRQTYRKLICAINDHIDVQVSFDWGGDPGVIGGTFDIVEARCRYCGQSVNPEGYSRDYDQEFYDQQDSCNSL